MAGDQFEKDFGYLMPFLDKVAEAANSIQDQAAREEFIRLVGGEKARWTRIRQLLSGAPASPKALPSQPLSESKNEPAAPSRSNDEAKPRPVLRFTVGSLKPRSR